MSKYDELETTAQRVYKYLSENVLIKPKRIPYQVIADEIGRTRSSVSYAVGVLLRKGKISIQDGEFLPVKK